MFPWLKAAGNKRFDLKNLPGRVLHCRFNEGITVTGLGVSQWDDVSGNGNHLKQGVDTNRPAKQSDGSILFDGIDNFLKADTFVFIQPESIYILAKQITWTVSDAWFDGDTASTGLLQQVTLTPQIAASADTPSATVSPALDTYSIISVVFNGASSVLQLNNDTPITGNFGIDTLDGFTLGAIGGGLSGWANIQVKEVMALNVADASTRKKVVDYWARIHGIPV